MLFLFEAQIYILSSHSPLLIYGPGKVRGPPQESAG